MIWTFEDVIYTILRAFSAGIGLYAAIYFYRLWKGLEQPPHSKFPFMMMGLANLGCFIVYTLAVFRFDGFGTLSNVGRIVQIFVLIFQVFPVIISHNMGKMQWR